jgi:broad specificity phosphatase PhoE
MKNYISLAFLFLSLTLFAQKETATTIYMVRHAEKMTDNPQEKDPILTSKGNERALALSKLLNAVSLDAIYSTDYKRTRATAVATAKDQHLEIQLYDAKNIKAAAASMLQNNTGKNLLIIGHSNTVLETIEAMGAKKPFDNIADQDYNNLFLLIINPDGSTEVTAMHYGAPNSYTEGEQMMH